jgi:hypothetical protein
MFFQPKVILDLYLPASKRFCRTLELFGPIDAAMSTYRFYGTKVCRIFFCLVHKPLILTSLTTQVEIVLKKADTRSWTVLEKTSRDLGSFNLTFGVGGRTGTIGAKEVVLDATNQAKV